MYNVGSNTLHMTTETIQQHLFKMENCTKTKLTDLLTEKQLQHILDQIASESHVLSYDLRPASQGLSGFLGDHFRLTLNISQKNNLKKIHLFVKCLPLVNKPKSEFIQECKYAARENMVFKIFDEIPGDDGPNPWRTKGYFHNEKVLVMPDLSIQGYKVHPIEKEFDRNHVLVGISSIARFHAAFCNYITESRIKTSRNILEENKHVMSEPIFKDCPWLRAGVRVTYNILKEYSPNWKTYPENLLDQLTKLYIKACDMVKEYEDTLNVIIHKDLWANNLFFKYSGEKPTNAILIDFQCIRYAPPAFDVMVFLYINTSEQFRKCHESEILDHYFKIFSEDIDDLTKIRLNNYNKAEFLKWCERARLFARVVTALICPYIMMEPNVARKHFDDSDKYFEYVKDRTYPVLSHAKENTSYRDSQLRICEEIVEKYCIL